MGAQQQEEEERVEYEQPVLVAGARTARKVHSSPHSFYHTQPRITLFGCSSMTKMFLNRLSGVAMKSKVRQKLRAA